MSKLTGANPIDVMIEFPPGKLALFAADPAGHRRGSRHRCEHQAGVGNVWSLETLRRWLAEKAGKPDVATLKQYVDMLPEHLVRRFISADQHAVVVAGRVPDVDASRIRADRHRAGSRSSTPVRAQHPGYTIAVTGLSAIAARNRPP